MSEQKVVELPPRAVVSLAGGGFGVVRNDAAGTVTPAPGIKSQEEADEMNARWGVDAERRDALLLAAGQERLQAAPAPDPRFPATFALLQHVAVFARIMERPFDKGGWSKDDGERRSLLWQCEHGEAMAVLSWKNGAGFQFTVAPDLTSMKRYALIGYCCEEGIELLTDDDGGDPEAAADALPKREAA